MAPWSPPSCTRHGTRHSLVASWQKEAGKGTALQSLTPANHPHAIHMPSIRMIQMSSSRLLLHHLDDTNYRQREANTPAAPCSFRPWRGGRIRPQKLVIIIPKMLENEKWLKHVETTNHPGIAMHCSDDLTVSWSVGWQEHRSHPPVFLINPCSFEGPAGSRGDFKVSPKECRKESHGVLGWIELLNGKASLPTNCSIHPE